MLDEFSPDKYFTLLASVAADTVLVRFDFVDDKIYGSGKLDY